MRAFIRRLKVLFLSFIAKLRPSKFACYRFSVSDPSKAELMPKPYDPEKDPSNPKNNPVDDQDGKVSNDNKSLNIRILISKIFQLSS
jgi:hypothetical protein